MLWTILSIFLVPLQAQTLELREKVIQDHTGGLTTKYSGNRLPDDRALGLMNALLDEDLGVVKRNGYSQYGTSAVCAAAVRGGWTFKATGGQDYFFVLCDNQVYSTTGDGTFTVQGGTVSSTQAMRAARGLGKLWFTNGTDYLWNTDGTSTTSYPTASLASLIGVWKNRLVLANYPGNLSTVLLSGYNNGTDFTIPNVQVDTSPVQAFLNGSNDGRKVTCMFDGFRDVLILWNEDQMFGLYGNGVNSFIMRILNHQVGCTEQGSVQEHRGQLKWLSKRGVELYDGAKIQSDPISTDIQDLVDSVLASDSEVLTLTQTSQSDFQAGNLGVSGPGSAMSATISAGNVVPSTWTGIDTTNENWNLAASFGGVSTIPVSNSLTLAIATYGFTNSGFEDGTLTNWTDSQGGWSVIAGSLYGSYVVQSPCAASLRTSIIVTDASDNVLKCEQNPSFPFALDTSTFTQNVKVKLTNASSCSNPSVATGLIASAAYPPGSVVLVNQTSNTTGCSSETRAVLDMPNDRSYGVSGNLTSRAFNTALSTPTWGNFNVSFSSSADAAVTFQTQASADGSSWDSAVTATPSAAVTSAQKKWIRYLAHYTSSVATKTAQVDSIALIAATTGQFISQCFNPGTITEWDLFQASKLDNNGSLTFAVSTGPNCGAVTVATGTWTTQANNTVIGVATAAYIGVRTTFAFTAGAGDTFSANPILQDLNISFRTSAGRPPVTSVVYDNRYWLGFTTNTATGASNDTVLVHDPQGKWSMFKGINAASLWNYKRLLYSGDSTTAGKVFLQDSGSDDNGADITFHIKTPFYSLDSWGDKLLYDTLVELKPANDPTLTSSLNVNYYVDNGTTTYTVGSFPMASSKNLITNRSSFKQDTQPTRVKNVSLEYLDTSQAPITIYRTMIRYQPLELK